MKIVLKYARKYMVTKKKFENEALSYDLENKNSYICMKLKLF